MSKNVSRLLHTSKHRLSEDNSGQSIKVGSVKIIKQLQNI